MSEREWYPADWVDEQCPPSKPCPEDFVQVDGTSYRLGYALDDKSILVDERELLERPLAVGDIVDFLCCDRFDDVEVTVHRDDPDGVVIHGAIPPHHNWVTVQGDIDTLRDSFAEILRDVFDRQDELHGYVFHDGEEVQRVTFAFARWSDRLPHLFSIEDGKPMFRQVPAAKAMN